MKSLNSRPVVFLARLYLGGIFFMAGYHKIFRQGIDQFTQQLHAGFGDTLLPTVFLNGFGSTLPFLEFLVGLFLIVGFFRKVSFTVAGVLCMLLSQGQFMIHEYATAANNGVYFLVAVVGLLLASRPVLAADSYFN